MMPFPLLASCFGLSIAAECRRSTPWFCGAADEFALNDAGTPKPEGTPAGELQFWSEAVDESVAARALARVGEETEADDQPAGDDNEPDGSRECCATAATDSEPPAGTGVFHCARCTAPSPPSQNVVHAIERLVGEESTANGPGASPAVAWARVERFSNRAARAEYFDRLRRAPPHSPFYMGQVRLDYLEALDDGNETAAWRRWARALRQPATWAVVHNAECCGPRGELVLHFGTAASALAAFPGREPSTTSFDTSFQLAEPLGSRSSVAARVVVHGRPVAPRSALRVRGISLLSSAAPFQVGNFGHAL